MKAEFNIASIKAIVLRVRQFKKLFVATNGQMWTVERDAEEAVRTLNAGMDDPEMYIGIATLTEDMVTPEKIREYGRDVEKFNKLFDTARKPLIREVKPMFEKKKEPEVSIDDAAEAEIEALLKAKPEPAPVKPAVATVKKAN